MSAVVVDHYTGIRATWGEGLVAVVVVAVVVAVVALVAAAVCVLSSSVVVAWHLHEATHL